MDGLNPSIREYFRNRQPLQSLVDDLVSGRADLMNDSRLRIQGMDWPQEGLISLDNRRMWCFMRFRSRFPQRIVRVKAHVWRLPTAFARLVQ